MDIGVPRVVSVIRVESFCRGIRNLRTIMIFDLAR